jgi:hypothetical protein
MEDMKIETDIIRSKPGLLLDYYEWRCDSCGRIILVKHWHPAYKCECGTWLFCDTVATGWKGRIRRLRVWWAKVLHKT